MHRDGILILPAPKSRKVSLIGDKWVHDLCGQEFWGGIVKTMQEAFRAREFTRGLVEGIGLIGELLAQHFPREADAGNELPDNIVERP